VKRRELAVLVGALCAVVFAFSMVSTAMAADDFKHWSIGTQIMYLNTDLDSEGIASTLKAEDTMTGGLVVEYFFTPNLSAEVVAAVAHADLEVLDGVLNGSTWILPPSVYVKYHPMPQWKVSPYVGAGVNWIYYWDESLNVGGTNLDLNIDNGFGWNVKVGADIKITENVYANLDIMYLNNETELDIADVARNADLDVEVWSYNVGLKYRF
jgi:outer membrane protein